MFERIAGNVAIDGMRLTKANMYFSKHLGSYLYIYGILRSVNDKFSRRTSSISWFQTNPFHEENIKAFDKFNLRSYAEMPLDVLQIDIEI